MPSSPKEEEKALFADVDRRMGIVAISESLEKVCLGIALEPDKKLREQHAGNLSAALAKLKEIPDSISDPVNFGLHNLEQCLIKYSEPQRGKPAQTELKLSTEERGELLWAFVSKHVQTMRLADIKDTAEILQAYSSNPAQAGKKDDFVARFFREVIQFKSAQDQKSILDSLSRRTNAGLKPTTLSIQFTQLLNPGQTAKTEVKVQAGKAPAMDMTAWIKQELSGSPRSAFNEKKSGTEFKEKAKPGKEDVAAAVREALRQSPKSASPESDSDSDDEKVESKVKAEPKGKTAEEADAKEIERAAWIEKAVKGINAARSGFRDNVDDSDSDDEEDEPRSPHR